jgi:hypothetical protein
VDANENVFEQDSETLMVAPSAWMYPPSRRLRIIFKNPHRSLLSVDESLCLRLIGVFE